MGTPSTSAARVRAPEPTIAPITSLASRVLSGDIVLPKFQRAFVWTPQQILYLLDSVRRNYPIGSLLMWRTTAKLASGHEIAGLDTVPQHEGAPVHYVLDGQQRLASLVGALHGSGAIWEIGYDLEREEFLHLTRTPRRDHTSSRSVISPRSAQSSRGSSATTRAASFSAAPRP
ncbi:DUF262 domain-containing protein [Streptomyces sp. NPDC096538]|uniref:DUF262 domain-containing protein n=1 Tax=Streptomyces sp. NPDC096538 TaxID=3155427 RepID=UPI0033232D70